MMAVASETTADTSLMYSTTGINHHMLHGCSEVKMVFFYLEFKAWSTAVRSTAGKGSAPRPRFFLPAVLLSFFISSPPGSLVQIDKIHILYLYSSGHNA